MTSRKSLYCNKLHKSRRRLSRAVLLLLAAAALGGCAGTSGGPTPSGDGADHRIYLRSSTLSDDQSAPDLSDDPRIPIETDVRLALDETGRATMADLELLSRTALTLAAEDRLEEAQDHLFVMADQAEMEPPAGADSVYVAHQRSLQRRVQLLGGILAEQFAFSGAWVDVDSLLADGYARLEQSAFPDSLVPATGVHLSPMTVDLLKVDNQEVNRWVTYFSDRGRDHFQLWLERKAVVDSMITAILDEHGLPRELIYLAVIESGLSPRAVSNVGAVGMWQFMGPTGAAYGLRQDSWVDERRDVEMSTRAACRYLINLYKQFDDWALVLAAYNAGEGRVDRLIQKHGHDDFWNLRLPSQTTAHIPKFIAAARIGEDPERYGFTVPQAAPLRYDLLSVDDATDFDVIARCAGVPVANIRELNPGLLRGASAPNRKDYPVRVPSGTGAMARIALSKIPPDKRLTWSQHRVERGETLGRIAGRYGTSVANIASMNKLKSPYLLRPGDRLLIPMPGELSEKARQRIDSAPPAKSRKGSKNKAGYAPPAGAERVSYEVRQGDTVGGIARKLGVSVGHLRQVNGLPRSNLIRVGQRLFAYRKAG